MTQSKKPDTTKKNECPEDIKPGWLNLIRAFQAAASKNRGFAILRATIAVGPSGEPVLWFVPDIEKLSPASMALDPRIQIEPSVLAALAEMASNS